MPLETIVFFVRKVFNVKEDEFLTEMQGKLGMLALASPFIVFAFWLNTSDELSTRFIGVFVVSFILFVAFVVRKPYFETIGDTNLDIANRTNKITKFEVKNGTGKQRGHLVVNIKWKASQKGAELCIWRSEGSGHVHNNAADLKHQKEGARQIGFKKNGKKYNLSDGEVEVNKAVNYYAWIELPEKNLVGIIDFRAKRETFKVTETTIEALERIKNESVARAKEKEATAKLKPVKEPEPVVEISVEQKIVNEVTAKLHTGMKPEQLKQLAENIIKVYEYTNKEDIELVNTLVLEVWEKIHRQ